jgi:hypothetical protein
MAAGICAAADRGVGEQHEDIDSERSRNKNNAGL